jgi:hypothetical protein
MNMPISFKDQPNGIIFKYFPAIPAETMKLRIKGEPAYKMNVAAFWSYGFYERTLYSSYKDKPGLAPDIKERKEEYKETSTTRLGNSRYRDPLHHYSVAASLGAAKEWKDPAEEMKCYIAYQYRDGHKSKVGFVHFKESAIDGKPVVYIAQAGVKDRGKGVGGCLMECVLTHYPPETEFYVLTRRFNTDAIGLYQKKLKFDPIGEREIKQLGYDERYCGFKHTTTELEINAMKAKQAVVPTPIIRHKIDQNKLAASDALRRGFWCGMVAATAYVAVNIVKTIGANTTSTINKPKI